MSPDALGKLLDRHAAALVLYARQFCACPDDVVQNALLKLVRLRTPPANVLGWLYSAVRSAALDASRSDRRRQKHEAAAASEGWFTLRDESGLDGQTAADALATLPLELREVLVARIWGELTFEEIAATVGSSAATCHRRYTEGLGLLREKLGVRGGTS